ncbi:class I SAM-dependent methyltransferase [Allopontixanthobacter sp.]|uniref:class I SAM-dependent methyltransferase n=1 Tax=Allopontixanthobacter sp. TaxID=2906452 RepID=UPI002ABB6045|nr:methyltransferase domain-containing protein [Allopontixanthobacter sp.]MDZ4307569.1 methyltransferase domain-containing protein [Allopontixanthobacter sp.]
MNHHDEADAWRDFWTTGAKSKAGCLPNAHLGVGAAQAQKWTRFAKTMPVKARILDLATGDGRVMHWIFEARRDAKLTGIDLAPVLPAPLKGTKMRSGVPMEQLPFRAGAFSAVTSQFGFEYGNIAKVSAEVARVLQPGGRFAILTHRQDGPILEQNLERRKQLNWALHDQKLIEKAKRSLVLRAAGVSAVPTEIAVAPAEGARLFGAHSAAWEVAEAVRQSLALGRNDVTANVQVLLDQIAAKATNELGRIASLEAACARTADDTEFLRTIAAGGLTQLSIEPVIEAGKSAPFADFRILVHTI